jgi:hypothetical protein
MHRKIANRRLMVTEFAAIRLRLSKPYRALASQTHPSPLRLETSKGNADRLTGEFPSAGETGAVCRRL